MERFDKAIAPEIEGLLKNADLGDADIYLRLYMIGRSATTSRPVIMVCCSNAEVRTRAEEAIRASQIPQVYPEFALGASALPLEQPGLIRALADATQDLSMADGEPYLGPGFMNPGQIVGRRLCVVHNARSSSRLATAGAVIRVGYLNYQITTSHILDDASASESDPSNPNECHFDGMSEDDEDDTEDGVTQRSEASNNIQTTTRASVLSDSAVRPGLAGQRAPDYGTAFVQRSTPQHPQPLGTQPDSLYIMPELMSHDCRNGPNPGLDYALIALRHESHGSHGYKRPNEITVRGDNTQKTISIQAIAGIPAQEMPVIVVTASRGAIHGVLMPTVVYFRNAALPRFQKLYPLLLQKAVNLGDSGSVVVDEGSGLLYGHVVRGIPGTTTAYIVAITEVFEDLEQRTASAVQLVPSATRSIPTIANARPTTPTATDPRPTTPADNTSMSSEVPFGFVLKDTGNWGGMRDRLGTPELTMASNTEPSLYASESDLAPMHTSLMTTHDAEACSTPFNTAECSANWIEPLDLATASFVPDLWPNPIHGPFPQGTPNLDSLHRLPTNRRHRPVPGPRSPPTTTTTTTD
jgi:hypothetical protein